MYVQLKTGHDTDAGPAWIARVNFTRTWRTAYVHGRTLRRVTETARANFEDAREADEAETDEIETDGAAPEEDGDDEKKEEAK